jgi:hypothetical protein
MQYRLRTLLILLAVGPVALWLGWLAWERSRPRPAWYIHDSFNPPLVYPEKAGYRWKLTRQGLKQVPDNVP